MGEATLRSRGDARREHILEVARALFLEEGFAAVSMSEIAQRLGGSKGTLYNHFNSKTELFNAVMAKACHANSEALFAGAEEDVPVADALRRMGRAFLGFVLTDEAMGVFRVVVAEAQRFPELGQAFYEAGPKVTNARLGAWMQRRMDRGELRQADPSLAARQFIALVKSWLYNLRIWNVVDSVSQDEIAAHVDTAVDLFLAGYGA